MKKRHYALAASVSALLCAGSFAGTEYQQTSATSPVVCGVGWYFGLEGGGNIYQDFGDARFEEFNGNQIKFDTNDHIGFFSGIKFGYIFGTGTWRFGIEEDW